ncbi:unnamed protein product [Bemisia tabaci]|uniref:Rabphilin n=1 Tax=Bemisia tabaci TaxID=7038 RepID=A0A9P0EYG8_BEMTA|nr:PREDICTED: rab effector Noc2-like [Bemisia tabaci]CAH0384462.1 unnamed protein product [Bemisia tabaci]
MVDLGTDLNSDWICPNNRQLALRAKLQIGWSMKNQQLRQHGTKWKPLDENEQQIIANVVQRAEALENVEQERIGRLVERLENMKRNMMGTGDNQCILCGDRFGLLGSTCTICYDCRKAVCPKCSIETSSSRKSSVWLCKICAETREIWKKSGAWFYKGIPKYVIPPKKNNDSKYAFKRRIIDTGVIDKNLCTKPSVPSSFLKVMEEREREKEKSQEYTELVTPERNSPEGQGRSMNSWKQDRGASSKAQERASGSNTQDISGFPKSRERSSSFKAQERNYNLKTQERNYNLKTQERNCFKVQDWNTPIEAKTTDLRSKFEDSLTLHSK